MRAHLAVGAVMLVAVGAFGVLVSRGQPPPPDDPAWAVALALGLPARAAPLHTIG